MIHHVIVLFVTWLVVQFGLVALTVLRVEPRALDMISTASELYPTSVLHFLRNYHAYFYIDHTNLQFHQQCLMAPSPSSLAFLVFSLPVAIVATREVESQCSLDLHSSGGW